MTLEKKLAGWTKPSSANERDKQDRAERMVREAVGRHSTFSDLPLKVYPKGSYANNTNVRSDSDVDIAVKCTAVMYWGEHTAGAHPADTVPYTGVWTPEKFREELVAAMKARFPDEVDTSGSTAIHVAATSSRVDIDVVPCFDYRYYFSASSWHDGAKVFKKNGLSIDNYSDQQLTNGKKKNVATHSSFKRVVRILKRLENVMVDANFHREVPSYFVECLVYNVPNGILDQASWTSTVRGTLDYIASNLVGGEPSENDERWAEVNECKYLFNNSQPWSRKDGREFARSGLRYLGYES